ncbi:uncharacterized protein LOC118978402 [Sturnira hondurensis]|uniref:uncharacterized protein LOC118978402 n=1 Tax=Sturnira hondurensis TaxID=192404 RepID=UPI00187956D5|nr:uncharacterized protein LOC118978402 [Sturnira hondurensis]
MQAITSLFTTQSLDSKSPEKVPGALECLTPFVEKQQVVDEDPQPIATREGKELHTTETQSNPEITVTTQESGDPGPFHGQKRTSRLKLPRLHRKKMISKANMEQVAHIKQTGPDDLDPQMAESKEQSWEDQLIDKQPGPVSTRDEIGHTAEDPSRPQAMPANQESRTQGLEKGQRNTPTLTIPHLNAILPVFVCDLEEDGAHFKQTRPSGLKPKEADTRMRRWEGWTGGELW